jgi:hypothetical protein
MARVVFPFDALNPLLFTNRPVNNCVEAISDGDDGNPKQKRQHGARLLLGAVKGRRNWSYAGLRRVAPGLGCGLVFPLLSLPIAQAARDEVKQSFTVRRAHAHRGPALVHLLFHRRRQQDVLFDADAVLAHVAQIVRSSEHRQLPLIGYWGFLKAYCGSDVPNIIVVQNGGQSPVQNRDNASMDFLFSPLSGLVTAFLLQGSGPILPDVSAMFAASPVVEQRAAEPVAAPSIDRLLALPSGFRAQGYESLIISRNSGN